ncbi:MAG: putative glycoside hydrolase [Ruminococcus sp.]
MKNKGRKIYKTKEKNYYGKTPMGKFLSGALTVLLIGGIGFLGYSLAEPIINYSKKTGDDQLPVSDTTNNTDLMQNTTIAVDSVVVPENTNLEVYKAASLTPADLSDTARLQTALQNINVNVGYEYVSVPLKIAGGELYYASAVSEAQLCGAVKSTLTLSEITAAIRTAGYRPVAEISLLRDSLAPQTYPDMAYTTTGDGSRWIDNDAESGGKPWISPYSDRAVTYLNAISDEVAAEDFDKVICADVIFPKFRESDLAILDEQLSSSERYLTLTSLVNSLYGKFMNGGTAMILEVSAVDILQENYDVIQPWLLDVNTVVLDIDLDELGTAVAAGGTVYEFTGTVSDKVSKLIGLVEYKLEGFNVIVRISGQTADPNELVKAKDIIGNYGYNSFMIG